MFVCLIQLVCDGDGCLRTYPANGGEDGCIFNRTELRLGAYSMDWHHDRVNGKDYCPQCDAKLIRAKKAGKA
jgi:hypothetical protein